MHSASSLHAAADALSAKCAKDRLARWKLAVQDDIPRLASWIKRDPPASPAGPPLSDAAQAEFWASEWESRWKAGFTDLAALDRLSSCLPQLPPADLQVTAEQLRAAVLKASRTAPGLDQWAPAHWRHLPLAFFEALAALWRRCLDLGRLPAPWRHVRIALVPKPDGSRRPIAIAALAYRAVMTASMRALRPWILSWVPAALCGGVPARHPGLLHDRLFGAMSLARSHHRDLSSVVLKLTFAGVLTAWTLRLPFVSLRAWAPRLVLRRSCGTFTLCSFGGFQLVALCTLPR